MTEGTIFDITVDLTTSGTLACELVVTLLANANTATGKKQYIDFC